MKKEAAGTEQEPRGGTEPQAKPMWLKYRVEVSFEDKLAASIPKTPKEILGMLEHRMPSRKPDNAVLIEELAAQVVEEVGVEEEEEAQPGYSTFKKDKGGLIYDEGRTWRGHIKDCAGILGQAMYKSVGAFKAKVANRVYVEPTEIIPMFDSQGVRISAISGTEERFVHGMTPKGMRSSIKYIDYVIAPIESFTLKVFNDDVITPAHILAIFEYGAVHGKGQERSEGWGRYRLLKFEQIP